MSNDRRAQLNVWEDKEEEDEALEIDYQALMEWWKNNPIPKPFLVYETSEMILKQNSGFGTFLTKFRIKGYWI